MTIEFDMKREDLVAFHRYCFDNSRHAQRKFWQAMLVWPIGLCAVFGCLVWLNVSFGQRPLLAFLCASPVLLMAVGFLVIFPSTRIREAYEIIEAQVDEDKIDLGLQTLTISPDDITLKRLFSFSTCRWKVIREVVRAGDYGFIHTAPNNAYIVPKRAFPDESAFHEFLAEAERFRRQAMTQSQKGED